MNKHASPTAVLVLVATLSTAPALLTADQGLPRVNAEAVTVSGVSSGGAMAQQLHLAYAELFQGAGIIAGVPFGCAEGKLGLALGPCMGKQEALPIDGYRAALEAAAAAGNAAPLEALQGDRAWVFHGALDAAVGAYATDATAALYEALLGKTQLTYVNDVQAAHHFPTLESGNPCDESAPPWLGACGFDAAGELLSFIYGGLAAPTDAQRTADAGGAMKTVELPGAAAAGMAETAYLFVPEACPPKGCRLHVALHGCAMATGQNGKAFIEDSGYLPWARANGIVVAFPEAVPQPLNPLGCWDWWGYTGANYLQRDGAQMKVIADWVSRLTSS
ncbi:MAG: PHB depolymerase family esterase [Pseudomonadota bacterium]